MREVAMHKGRLEAFTDGVIAVIITIMVLEMKVPHGSDIAALASTLPVFLTYVLSYTNVAIFWNNHHHMLQVSQHVDGRSLWANMFLLFWLSLVPFMIRWMEETDFVALPTAAYGFVLVMAAIGYLLLERMLIACNGADSTLARAIGGELKGKLSISIYAVAMLLAFVQPWIAIALYIAVAILWFVPDRRIESII
ncbi:MAG: TMEM175 family protein [Methylocella sp.]